MLGTHPIGTRPIGSLARRSSAIPVLAVFTAAGVGLVTFEGNAIANAALAGAGSGAFSATLSAQSSAALSAQGMGAFPAAMIAKVSSMATFQGSGFLQMVDTPASEAMFGGVGAFASVSYAFYGDTEMAAPREEIRMVYVPWEERNPVTLEAVVSAEPRETYAAPDNRVAVVPYENRVYEALRKPRVPYPSNRRRKP